MHQTKSPTELLSRAVPTARDYDFAEKRDPGHGQEAPHHSKVAKATNGGMITFHRNPVNDHHIVKELTSDHLSQAEIDSLIEEYERKYQMSSDELVRRVKDGTAPDSIDHIDWYWLVRSR